MGLPSIAPYSPLAREELPPPRVEWRLDPERAVFLIHDMQRYFLRVFKGEEPIRSVLATLVEMIAWCDARSIPVVYSAQPGRQPRSARGLQADFWGPGMGSDEEDRAIVESIAPRTHHHLLVKHRYSAFQRTDLEDRMRAWGRDQLLIGGIYTHIGCLLTAADAFMRDIEPFLIADALADFSRERHLRALEQASGLCAVVLHSESLGEES